VLAAQTLVVEGTANHHQELLDLEGFCR